MSKNMSDRSKTTNKKPTNSKQGSAHQGKTEKRGKTTAKTFERVTKDSAKPHAKKSEKKFSKLKVVRSQHAQQYTDENPPVKTFKNRQLKRMIVQRNCKKF